MCLSQNRHFVASKDEWDTKEDTGKSMKNALYEQQCPKRHLSSGSNIKQQKIKSISLGYASLKASGSQAIGQSVSQ